jgi:hypothetical protein
MSELHKGFIAGLAIGACLAMLTLLTFIWLVPTTAFLLPLAAVGVFMGALAIMLAGMMWVVAAPPATTYFVVAEIC